MMTLDDTINAYEYCATSRDCEGCPYKNSFGCRIDLDADILRWLKGYRELLGASRPDDDNKKGKCEMEKTRMSAPWVEYYNKVKALLGDDPDIVVEYDEDARKIKVFVNGTEKADALAQLLPAEKEFGNIKVTTAVIPANTQTYDKADLLKYALAGNPNFAYMQSVDGILSNRISYVVFKKKVAQYWNDNLGDINGNVSTLYQELAKEIFGAGDGILYCTDNED